MGKKKHKKNRTPAVQESPVGEPLSANPLRDFIDQYAIVAVFAICLVSFFIHTYASDFEHRARMTTVDEAVYSRLGLQLKNGESYNTIQMYNENLKAGRKLPEYFKDPLFKHPPMYPFLISMAYITLDKKPNYSFEELYKPAVTVSNLMGCLLIFLTFLMGRRFYDVRVGLLAALIIAIDVNLLNCSQKVWMDSTLSAFFWLAIYLFHKGLEKPWFLILAGMGAGCALLTKYPAALVLVIFFSYIVLFERQVFKSGFLYMGLMMTGILFLPWANTVFETYGKDLVSDGSFGSWKFSQVEPLFYAALSLGFVSLLSWLIKWKKPTLYQKIVPSRHVCAIATSVVLGLFLTFLCLQSDFRASLVTSLDWSGFPQTGWTMYSFNEEPRYFYLKHILEYSPYYIFFFAAFILGPLGKKEDALLLIVSFWTLIFASYFGSYQGRYILYFTPAAILLIGRVIFEIYDFLLQKKNAARISFASLFSLVLIYFYAKTLEVSILHAINNNVAYY